jgi:hypothetical protein
MGLVVQVPYRFASPSKSYRRGGKQITISTPGIGLTEILTGARRSLVLDYMVGLK